MEKKLQTGLFDIHFHNILFKSDTILLVSS